MPEGGSVREADVLQKEATPPLQRRSTQDCNVPIRSGCDCNVEVRDAVHLHGIISGKKLEDISVNLLRGLCTESARRDFWQDPKHQ